MLSICKLLGGGNLSAPAHQENKRSTGLDILRTVAIVAVVAGHYFMYSGFNSAPFNTPAMFLLGTLNSITAIGVPIFMMLTGYLTCRKTISRSYFKGITRVLVSYVVLSVVMILFREMYLGEHMSPVKWLLKITDFSAIPYAWYIEMWIGLFLLTPFLNILWSGIADRNHRKLLLFILFLCSALPDFFNRYGVHLAPGYWESAAYPLLFFFAGAYIRDYRPAIDTRRGILAVLALALINPLLSILLQPGGTILHLTGDPNGIISTPVAILIFILLYTRNIGSSIARGAVTRISLLSLDIYLISYMFDMIVYPCFADMAGSDDAAVGWAFFLIVPVLFALDFSAAYVKDAIFRAVGFIGQKAKAVQRAV